MSTYTEIVKACVARHHYTPKTENIDSKIAGLKERGFKDPVKMIVSSPSILGYAFENIDSKIKYLKRVGVLCGINSTNVIENIPVILGCSIKKVKLTVGILFKHCKATPSVSIMRNCLFCPIQKQVLTSLEMNNILVTDLIRISKKRSENMSEVVDVLSDNDDRLSRLLCSS